MVYNQNFTVKGNSTVLLKWQKDNAYYDYFLKLIVTNFELYKTHNYANVIIRDKTHTW